jgi:general stress protein 26
MSQKALQSLSKKMSGIDTAMFSTQSAGGQMQSRPMSNNGEVEYDGTSYYFAYADSSVVKDVKRDSAVALNFQSKEGLYVAVQGKAKLSTNKDEMAEHWKPELKQWFKDGLETEGITMIQVDAKHIRYWDTSSEAYDEGQIDL